MAVLAVLAGVGCAGPEKAAYNLRALHDFDGTPRHTAPLLDSVSFALRRSGAFSLLTTLGLVRTQAAEAAEGAEGDEGADDLAAGVPRVRVGHMWDAVSKELFALARSHGDDPYLRGLQIEVFGWLAASEAYTLTRERSVLELGVLGRALGVERPLQRVGDAPAAGPEEVGPAVREVLAEARRGDTAATERAARELLALDMDHEGTRRALAALNAALRIGNVDADRLLPYHRKLAESTIALVLGEALLDQHGLVRAAAMRAGASLSEPARLEILAAWASADTRADRAPDVLHAVAELAAQGVPAAERERWLARLYVIAEDPHGPASVAACRALGALVGDGFTSLRPEDWLLRLRELGTDVAPETPIP